MNLERINTRRLAAGHAVLSSGSRASVSLNSAFVNGTSGAAVAIRFVAPTASPIDALYVFLDGVNGTLGNISMECKIFNASSNAARPGTTVRATSSSTTMPSAADKWIRFQFGTPYTPSVNEVLWLVVYNTASAPATDYPGIMTGTNTLIGDGAVGNIVQGYSTANGFTINGTGQPEMPFVVVAGGVPYGQPFTQRASVFSSNTLERGIQITLPSDVVVAGMYIEVAASNFSSFRLLADATAPGGTPLHSIDLDSTSLDLVGAAWFSSPITLNGGVTYKGTLSYGNSTASPACLQIEDYASYSSIFDALRGYDTFNLPWSVIDNGAGGWTVDKSICPGIALIVSDFPTSAGGARYGGINNSFVRRAT